MRFHSWIAILLLAAEIGVSIGAGAARAANKQPAEEEGDKTQEMWDMQVKYAGVAGVSVGLAAGAFWLLSNSDKRKKQYAEELRKQDKLDPNEGMPIG